jgi:hypothetical protein
VVLVVLGMILVVLGMILVELILGVGSGGPEGWFWGSWGWFWWSWGWFWNLVVLGLVLVILESGGPFR